MQNSYLIQLKKAIHRTALILTALLLAAFTFSCRSADKTPISIQNETYAIKSSARKIVSRMSTREKIGQCMMMNFRYWSDNKDATSKMLYNKSATNTEILENFKPVSEPNKYILQVISDYHIGSVILFRENLASKQKALDMISQMNQAAVSENNLPLIFGIDQEGGNVQRIPFGTIFPSAMACGKTSAADTKLNARNIGEELDELGIGINFAPVCDVMTNKANPVIGIRSFSENPEEAAFYAAAFSDGLHEANTLSCAKHFPGHGDTAVDSHLKLPMIIKSKADWTKCEMIPFQKVINSGVDMIMTAHIQLPALDNSRIKSLTTGNDILIPATFSEKIITETLKNKMGFSGAVISDAMDMNAIAGNFNPSYAFIKALNAGVDIICHPVNVYSRNDIALIEEVFQNVERAIEKGYLKRERLNNAAQKAVELKIKAGLIDESGNALDHQRLSANRPDSTNRADSAIGTDSAIGPDFPNRPLVTNRPASVSHAAHVRKIQYEAVRKSANKIASSTDARALFLKSKNILVISNATIDIETASRFIQKNRGGVMVDSIMFGKNTDSQDDVRSKIQASDLVILFTKLGGEDVRNPLNQYNQRLKKITAEIKRQGKDNKTVAVSLFLPYDEKKFSSFLHYNAYGYSPKLIEYSLEAIFTELKAQN